MLGLPHVVRLCGYLSWFSYLCPRHTLSTWLKARHDTMVQTVTVSQNKNQVGGRPVLQKKKKLDMDVSQRKEGRYEGGWHSLILSPVQLAFLMAFKITRPPLIPPCRTPPPPHFLPPFLLSDPPPPPSTPTTFHIRAPINILNPCVHYPQLQKQPYLPSQKHGTTPPTSENSNQHTYLMK